MSVLRVAPREFAEEAVEAMDGPALGQKHERALARDYANAAHAAELDGLGTDRALSCTSMHPNARNARLGTIMYDRVRNFG